MGDGPVKRSWTSPSRIVPTLTNVARNFINFEECFERLVCEVGEKYLENHVGMDGKNGKVSSLSSNSIDYRSIIGRCICIRKLITEKL